jgi:hypothetical protein
MPAKVVHKCPANLGCYSKSVAADGAMLRVASDSHAGLLEARFVEARWGVFAPGRQRGGITGPGAAAVQLNR